MNVYNVCIHMYKIKKKTKNRYPIYEIDCIAQSHWFNWFEHKFGILFTLLCSIAAALLTYSAALLPLCYALYYVYIRIEFKSMYTVPYKQQQPQQHQ